MRLSHRLLHLISSLLFVIFIIFPKSARADPPIHFDLLSDQSSNCHQNCMQVISADGFIDENSFLRFLQLLQSKTKDQLDLKKNRILLLNSPGGTIVGALRLGLIMRYYSMTVVVGQAEAGSQPLRVKPAYCMSACVYILMGGKNRLVSEQSKVGVHRSYSNNFMHDPAGGMMVEHRYAPDKLVQVLRNYCQKMGINPDIISLSETVSPESIHLLTDNELSHWRVGKRVSALPMSSR